MSTDFQLRLGQLRSALSSLSARLDEEVGPLMGTLFPGEIRSRHRVTHGLEPESKDVFFPGSDARQIDLRHLPPTLARDSFETVIARRELRQVRYTHYSDSELILVLDLSVSQLAGCFDAMPPEHFPQGHKLWGLFLAASVFFALGEKAGFVLRAVFARDGRGEYERMLRPREFRFRALDRMVEELCGAYERSSENDRLTESFSIAAGLEAALEVRARSVVVLVSDFLDPVGDYRERLLEVMARHHVMLVDVAGERDVFVPPPGFRWREPIASMQRQGIYDRPWRDFARHLEMETWPRPLRGGEIGRWNTDIAATRRDVQSLAGGSGALFCEEFRKLDVAQALRVAGEHLALIGR